MTFYNPTEEETAHVLALRPRRLSDSMNVGQTTPFTRFVGNGKVMNQISSSDITRKSSRSLTAFARQHDIMVVGEHNKNAEI